MNHSSSIAYKCTVGWGTTRHDDVVVFEHTDVYFFCIVFVRLVEPSGIAAAFCHCGQAFWHRDGGASGVKWFGLDIKPAGLVGCGEAAVGSDGLEMGTHAVYQAVHGFVGGGFD